MFKTLIAILVCIAIAGCTKNNNSTLAKEEVRDIENGKTLFNDNCVSCHVGRTEVYSTSHAVNPRDLKLSLLSEEQMYHIIKKGTKYYGSLTDYMIGYENIYSDKEIKDIVAYIHKELNENFKLAKELYDKSEKIPADKSQEEILNDGRKVYLKRCIHCHGASGKGDGVAVKASNGNLFPYDLSKTLLTDEQKFLFTKYGSQHWGASRDDMPAWGNVYDDYQIHSVIEYINSMLNKSNNTK